MASKRLRKANQSQDEPLAVDMSPMIDMVFLLLIFFIVNATAIIVRTDPAVVPPVASNSVMQQDREGRIVVNVRRDGTFTAEEFDVILPDEAAIFEYINNLRIEIEGGAREPKLHLRGDQDVIFRHSRTVVRAAAAAGVNQVVFAVFQSDRGRPVRED